MKTRSLILAVMLLHPRGAGAESASRTVVLATTTSTQDTGLLDLLVPALEQERALTVKVVAVGSGEALAMGRRGDADVLLVHSPRDEQRFMDDGFGEVRWPVMHNDFVLVGPAADPARVKGAPILQALQRIAAAQAPWASRGDRSGTHQRELELWRRAGLATVAWPTAISTGQGMGETLRVASEKGAYTLVDRGTFLALRATLALDTLVEGGADLLNSYSVIVVNAKKVPQVHVGEAREVAAWLTSPTVQRIIGGFGKETHGRALFVPDAR